MSRAQAPVQDLHSAESGATAVEYAIMVALVAAVVIAAVVILGSATDDGFECVEQTFEAAPASHTC